MRRNAPKVLIVEDEVWLAKVIDKLLQAWGWRTVSATTLADAYDAIAPDLALIILDLSLPGADGVDLLRDLKRSGNATPVLVCTARVELADALALLGPADRLETKPINHEVFKAYIQAIYAAHTNRPAPPNEAKMP